MQGSLAFLDAPVPEPEKATFCYAGILFPFCPADACF